MAQIAIAWSLSKPFVTAPVVGTTSLDKLRDLVGSFLFYHYAIIPAADSHRITSGGVHLKLSAEETKSIDDLYQPREIAGHW